MHIFRCCFYLGFYAVALSSSAVPGPPSDVQVKTNDSTSISVRWNAPKRPKGVVDGYYIHVAKIINGEFTGSERILSCPRVCRTTVLSANCYEKKVAQLEQHTTYKVVVFAFSRNGDGERSQPIEITTKMEVPGPPSYVHVIQDRENSNTTFCVGWEAPKRPNVEVKGYYIEVTKTVDGVKRILFCVGQCYKKQVLQLEPNTEYSVVVYAFNSMGKGEKSGPVKVHTSRAVPSPPRAVDVLYNEQDNTCAVVTWQPPEKTYGLPVLLYNVEVREQGTNVPKGTFWATDTAVNFCSLDPGVNYIVNVAARNAAGSSDSVEESFVLPRH